MINFATKYLAGISANFRSIIGQLLVNHWLVSSQFSYDMFDWYFSDFWSNFGQFLYKMFGIFFGSSCNKNVEIIYVTERLKLSTKCWHIDDISFISELNLSMIKSDSLNDNQNMRIMQKIEWLNSQTSVNILMTFLPFLDLIYWGWNVNTSNSIKCRHFHYIYGPTLN